MLITSTHDCFKKMPKMNKIGPMELDDDLCQDWDQGNPS